MDQPDIPVDRLLDLSGKVALVTGAGRGIGAGIVRRLAEAGAAVAVHYRGGKEAAEALVATVAGDGGKAMAIHGELTDRTAVESAFAAIGETLGPVDILVNNAARQTHSTIADMEPDEWRDTLATNLDAVFNTTRVATDAMVARGAGGVIVNIASIEGLQPALTHGHYATTKAGLIMFTRATALEFGRHGIRANAVSPGVIHAPGIEENWPEGVKRWLAAAPLGRMGDNYDVADAVLFLASPASRFITGANLVVDGGVTVTPSF
ncbi:SDR family NAD(P)-dependent oxidoreductase [Bauldia litoralis]|uniref:3-oxoacyl-[acyl-carrier protein] reductase n=1 Tax=Bauldia litoralis TaxID=665467 RepID=A0A1G6BNS9_9HYPH|nr:glucose 1-dehydrogenase [Bauldia litoralis]SDB22290.1 3-oxoacyl-[acyl-carrier protein] reductase [Bauldia litoralis]